ncbi:hypothetical protein BX661DRAFT_76834 [Kickxella alabastrina]|uniref:uncharacterized protein n=1 Tax=Kickxella alabastrina TaxID=61397 RepID=UPI00221F8999|nr:uncharacterized protein BX661DRAFT_76834 [Kickxella alabastrina]KAI7833527.1 hypothetical protein BX661DRAFT_76834 [Kickxella alabastrina]
MLSTNCDKWLFLSVSRLSGVSNSAIWPWSITRMRSLSITVPRLCAMVNTIQSLNSRRMSSCMVWSVLESTLAVASSKTTILRRQRGALQRLMSCRCPTLKLITSSFTHFLVRQPRPTAPCRNTHHSGVCRTSLLEYQERR